MIRFRALLFLLLLSPGRLGSDPPITQSNQPPRVALIGFTGNAKTPVERVITEALAGDERISIIDPGQVLAAVRGALYDGSINLSREEARRLGSAVGCDFFIIGKAELITRSDRENASFVEALVGVFIVDGRAGEMVLFDFIADKAASTESASGSAAKDLGARFSTYINEVVQWESSRGRKAALRSGELIEDMPDEDSPRREGFKAPEFLNRVRPDYPEEADRADVSATVEARVVLSSDGVIGEVEIIRWAGYGLESTAVRAIKQLKFTPAIRNGEPVSVRALIRYNFRRSRGADPITRESEKKTPERDLRQIFKPKLRPPV